MSYFQAIQQLPEKWRLPMLELVSAVEHNLREQLAVRRQDFDELTATVSELAEAQKRTEQRVNELAEAQKRTEQRVERLEIIVGELAEAQKRTEQRVERLEIIVGELAEAQKRTEQRVNELAEAQKRTEQRVNELAEAQKRTEQRVNELAEAQKRTEQRVCELAEAQKRMSDRLGQLLGRDLERRYRENVGAYFGRWLRPVEMVPLHTLRDTLEARLDSDQVEELMSLDVLVYGRLRTPESTEIWLAVEVSAVIDRMDVERARRRADLLCRAGYRAIAAVAGEAMTEGAAEAIQAAPVVVLQDGRSLNWDTALRDVTLSP